MLRMRIVLILMLFVTNASAGGKIMWQRYLHDTTRKVEGLNWFVVSKTIDQDQNIYITSLYYMSDSSVPVLHKLSKNGIPIWSKTLLPLNNNNRYIGQCREGKMYIDVDGNLVNIFCYSDTTADVNGKRYAKILLTKLDLNGQIITSKIENLTNHDNKTVFFKEARLMPNGDFYLGIYNNDVLTGSVLTVIRFNKNFDKTYEYAFDAQSTTTFNGSFSFALKDSLLFLAYGGKNLNYFVRCINMNTNQTIWNNMIFSTSWNYVFQLELMNGSLYIVSYKLFKLSPSNGDVLAESTYPASPILCVFDEASNKIYASNNASKIMSVYDGNNLNTLINKSFGYPIYNFEKVNDTLYAIGVEEETYMGGDWRLIRTYSLDTSLNIADSLSFTLPPFVRGLGFSHINNRQPDMIIDSNKNVILITELYSYKINNMTSCPISIYKICYDCTENYSGRVYLDMNQNCIFDSSDYAVPGNLVKIMPDNDYTITDNQGLYYFFNSSNTVTIESIPYINNYPFCNGISSISATLSNVTTDSIDFGYNFGEIQYKDIKTNLIAGIARPGFNQTCMATFTNQSAEPLFNTKVSISIDSHFTFISSSMVYDSMIGNTYYFTLDTLLVNSAKQIYLTINADVNLVSIGDTFNHAATAFLLNDINLSNNLDSATGIIVGSYDPNYIAVTPVGITPNHLIENESRLKYYVEFQNTGTDTAFTVKVNIPLDDDLDISSFIFEGATHLCRVQIEGKMLSFVFDNIQLVDSNKSYDSSIGYLNYSIATKKCKDGSKILATASIYFDFNKPVITNTVFNTIGRPGSLFNPDDVDDFNLFPNPGFSNEFNMVVNSISSTYTISIRDLTGRKIPFNDKNYFFNGKHYHNINIRDYSEGVYFIQLQTPKKVLTKKWLYSNN